MVPGTWNILIEGDEVRTKRSFNISFGKQQTVYVTVSTEPPRVEI